jgi:hypothetical protein
MRRHKGRVIHRPCLPAGWSVTPLTERDLTRRYDGSKSPVQGSRGEVHLASSALSCRDDAGKMVRPTVTQRDSDALWRRLGRPLSHDGIDVGAGRRRVDDGFTVSSETAPDLQQRIPEPSRRRIRDALRRLVPLRPACPMDRRDSSGCRHRSSPRPLTRGAGVESWWRPAIWWHGRGVSLSVGRGKTRPLYRE